MPKAKSETASDPVAPRRAASRAPSRARDVSSAQEEAPAPVRARKTGGMKAAAKGRSAKAPPADVPVPEAGGGVKRKSRVDKVLVDEGMAPAAAPRARVPVNAIVEQWQRERPDLDPAPMRLFGSLAQAHLLTTPYINRVLARYDLARGTFDVLSALRRSGPPFSLTPKQLAESLMLSGAGMTNRLDRLEAQHLIARLPEPNDRRSLKIQLTQKGVKLIDEIIPRIVEAQWSLVSSLGLADTERLIELLRRLTDVLGEGGPEQA